MLYIDLYQWFDSNKRILPWRETREPYAIWISEIILQQTRVVQGLEYYYRFMDSFPTVEALASADEQVVMRLWQGLGYYSRARNLHKAAKMIVSEGQGFPKTYEGLRHLSGVGDYTAGAIASFAYNLPYPALDGNVYRVLSRLTDCDIAFDTTAGKKHFHKVAEELLDKEHPRLFNSAIMELGALQCVPQNPDCETCPLRFNCLALAHGTVNVLPVRKPRPKLIDRYFNYYIYLHGNETLIHRRTEKDIWQHLYEFPLVEGEELSDSEQYFDLTHILSHRRIHARFHIKKVNTLPAIKETNQVSLQDLDDYPFSRLSLKAIERLETK